MWNQVEQIVFLFQSHHLDGPLTLLTQFCGPWKAWCIGSRWSSSCTAEVFLKQRLLWWWLSAGLCYGVFVIFLLTNPHRFSLWFKSGELADPSSTAITSGDQQMEECAVDASVVSSQGKAWYVEYNSCRSFAEDVCVLTATSEHCEDLPSSWINLSWQSSLQWSLLLVHFFLPHFSSSCKLSINIQYSVNSLFSYEKCW